MTCFFGKTSIADSATITRNSILTCPLNYDKQIAAAFFNKGLKMYQSIIKWVFRNIALPWALKQIPAVPTNWRDSEQVRLFIMQSAANTFIKELAQLTSTQWDDRALATISQIASNRNVWDTAWLFLLQEENSIPEPKPLRRRIADYFLRLFPNRGQNEANSVAQEAEQLIPVIQAVKTIYNAV
jgi:hypothetical protein